MNVWYIIYIYHTNEPPDPVGKYEDKLYILP